MCTTFAPHVHHICTTFAPHLHHICTTCAPHLHHICTTCAPHLHLSCTESICFCFFLSFFLVFICCFLVLVISQPPLRSCPRALIKNLNLFKLLTLSTYYFTTNVTVTVVNFHVRNLTKHNHSRQSKYRFVRAATQIASFLRSDVTCHLIVPRGLEG